MKKNIVIILIIFIVIIFLFFYIKNNPKFKGDVFIEPIVNFQNIKAGEVRIFGDDKDNLYVSSIDFDGNKLDNFILKDNLLYKIDTLPKNLINYWPDMYKQYDKNIKKYNVNVLEKKDLSCKGEIVLSENNIPVLIAGKSITKCFDIYSNNINKWFVVKPGNVYGTKRTLSYWLDGDKSMYIDKFTNLRNPYFIYIKKSDKWLLLTGSYINDSPSLYFNLSIVDIKMPK